MSKFDINNFEDPEVWDLICEGRTKGVFQLESNLGKHWAKEVQPRNIKELAALISLIRPGTLLAKDSNGKSMTKVYVDRKKGLEPVDYPDDSLEPILGETYGVLVYQEQSMKIAQQLAGFSLKDADALRKAIGKKKADLMEEMKQTFMDGAERVGIIKKEVAGEIFSWIEKSNRYAFNKSHAVSYAINAYWSAYCKCHRLSKFYISYMNRSDRKPKPEIELKQLIMDARMAGIDTYPPRLAHMYTDFLYKNEKIFFGLKHVKNVGSKECEKIQKIKEEQDISKFTWMDCLVKIIFMGKINKRAATALISIGAFNGINNRESRQKMLYEYDSWNSLSAREKQSIADNYTSDLTLAQCIELMSEWVKINKRRQASVSDIKQSLLKPFYDLNDDIASLADMEIKLLGCSLTCSKADSVNISTNMCKDVSHGLIRNKVNLSVMINSIRVHKTKNGKTPGQEMAFLCVEDSSGELDSVTLFPEAYGKYKDMLVERNTVLLNGEISKRDKNSIIVNKVIQV
jgi:DNA polymerase-3 subunit alpha